MNLASFAWEAVLFIDCGVPVFRIGAARSYPNQKETGLYFKNGKGENDMKIMKRAAAMLLVMCMVLAWLPGTAWTVSAADTDSGEQSSSADVLAEGSCKSQYTEKELNWTLSTDGVLSISGSGYMESFASLSDAPWYDYADAIREIKIGSEVPNIGSYAFADCKNVRTVDIPASVCSIGEGAFISCSGLESVVLPDTVTVLEDDVFRWCTALAQVSFGKNLEEIGSFAFGNCTSLTSITFPDSFSNDWGISGKIYGKAFAGCTSLKEITFGKFSAPYISSDAFLDVTATVHYPEGNETWLWNWELQSSNLQNYGGSLTWQPYDVPAVGGICGDDITWSYDDGVLTLTGTGPMYDYWTGAEGYGAAEPWGDYCKQIVTVNLSEGITTVGAGAFAWCWNLKTVNLPKSLNSIREYAFNNSSVSEIVIPEGTVEIGSYAFDSHYRIGLKNITFPSTLKTVGEGAFYCNGAANIYVPSLEAWCAIEFDPFFATPFEEFGRSNFYVNGELVTDLVIPYGITEIGDSQFCMQGCLTSIQIPDSVTHIGNSAFRANNGGCEKLTEIVFPASVEYIGRGVLHYNGGLKKIVVLNPDCVLDDGSLETDTPAVIYGYSGSTAEAYAAANEKEFVALEAYEVIEGANSTVKTGEGLTIRANGDFAKFESVAVDGLTVAPANYTVSEGSTIVTFAPEYLSTLERREHSVTVFFTDGVAETTLTVVCSHANKTEVAPKPATCQQEGSNGYYICQVCGKVFKADGITETTVEDEKTPVLAHDMAGATCEKPAACKREGCDYTEGKALGHSWVDATCQAPKYCDRCQLTQGEPLPHTEGKWQPDTKEHWKNCASCGTELAGTRQPHTDADADSVCEICGKAIPVTPATGDFTNLWMLTGIMLAAMAAATALLAARKRYGL